MAMHPNFPDWYRSAALTPQESTLNSRWEAVEAITKGPSADRVLVLAQLFVLPSSGETMVPGDLRDTFRKFDVTFPMRDNLQELRVLAGAALRLMIEQPGSSAPLAALALACGSFGPRLLGLPEPDHIDSAQRYLIQYSMDTRKTGTPASIRVPSFAKARLIKAVPDSLFTQNPPAGVHDPLMTLLASMASEFASALGQAQEAINTLVHDATVRKEEVAILWWLHSRYSTRLEKLFAELGYTAGALLFPIELADLTAFVPGSESIAAVIVQALQAAGAPSSAEPLTIAAATNALPRPVREAALAKWKASVPNALTPLLLALQSSLATEGTEDWFPVYRKACDMPIDRPFPLAAISIQLFRELMLLRAASEAK